MLYMNGNVHRVVFHIHKDIQIMLHYVNLFQFENNIVLLPCQPYVSCSLESSSIAEEWFRLDQAHKAVC